MIIANIITAAASDAEDAHAADVPEIGLLFAPTHLPRCYQATANRDAVHAGVYLDFLIRGGMVAAVLGEVTDQTDFANVPL